jgi:hypothetical protein
MLALPLYSDEILVPFHEGYGVGSFAVEPITSSLPKWSGDLVSIPHYGTVQAPAIKTSSRHGAGYKHGRTYLRFARVLVPASGFYQLVGPPLRVHGHTQVKGTRNYHARADVCVEVKVTSDSFSLLKHAILRPAANGSAFAKCIFAKDYDLAEGAPFYLTEGAQASLEIILYTDAYSNEYGEGHAAITDFGLDGDLYLRLQ